MVKKKYTPSLGGGKKKPSKDPKNEKYSIRRRPCGVAKKITSKYTWQKKKGFRRGKTKQRSFKCLHAVHTVFLTIFEGSFFNSTD